MAAMARKLLIRELRQIRQRKLSTQTLKKTEEYVLSSQLRDVVVPNVRLMDNMWKHSASFQDHVAIESAETKKNYTYRQLQKNISVFATSLHKKLGLKTGDVVAVMLPNCPEYPVVAFGSLQAGCILTTINPIYKEFEICHQISTTGPKIVITKPECYDTVVNGLKQAKRDARIIIIDNPADPIPNGAIRYTEVAEKGEADYGLLDKIEKKHDDLACIPFSSGTTGLPKGVEITYRNLLGSMEVLGADEYCYPFVTNGSYQEVLPCVLPFFHIYGMVITLLNHLAKGCKLITVEKFSANLYFDILKRENNSLLYVVPPLAILLGKHPDVKPEFFRNVRHIVCGAAPLSASDVEAVREKGYKNEFNQGYGATETSSCGTATFKSAADVDYSACGMVQAGLSIKFVDPQTGNPVPIGEQGELYMKGPIVMRGYYKNQKATKESITEDGFFKTGDLGYYDTKYGLYITDRIKELIKVKGMQVAPAELESLLRSHPAVADAAVIGVPHEFYGECPKAFVIKKKDIEISSEDLQKFVADNVASFKRIEEVIFVNDIPKTASGKILRKELKKMYE